MRRGRSRGEETISLFGAGSAARIANARRKRDHHYYLLLLLYYGSTDRAKGTAHTSSHFERTPFFPDVARCSRRLITYLAERSVVVAVAVGCRPLPHCSRCGCPAEYYDHCHCSSPNLRTRPQDTSITTTRSSREGVALLTRASSLIFSLSRKSVRESISPFLFSFFFLPTRDTRLTRLGATSRSREFNSICASLSSRALVTRSRVWPINE